MDYSYVGTGKGYVRKVGAAAPFIEIGNAAAIDFGVTEDVKTLLDRTAPGGGTRNEVRRISSVDFSASLSDYSPSNLCIGLFGEQAAIEAGTATDEVVIAYQGGLIPLKKLASSITTVKDSTATTTYTAGTDYTLTDGGLYIPTDSTIDDADSLKVTYAFGAKVIVQALTQSAGIYEFYFPGFNEARESKRFTVRAFRVRLGATDKVSLVTDDFGQLTIKGTVLKDDTQPAGLSQYFNVEMDA